MTTRVCPRCVAARMLTRVLVAGNRDQMAIMSLEPVPIQLHYLGYPCTSGANYVHYLVADAVVTPPELVQ